MHIVLTNDDGILALGLRALYISLKTRGHKVTVIAPMAEQSAVGFSLTLYTPLRVKDVKEHEFEGKGVYGSPVDCMKLGLSTFCSEKPDLVLSGINAGVNIGPDVIYSGTVAAAAEARHLGYYSMAVSMDSKLLTAPPLEQANYTTELIEHIRWEELESGSVLNLNFPNCPLAENKGLRLCPQTKAVWHDHYEQRNSPNGIPYWWISGVLPNDATNINTDKDLLLKNYITLTPLKFEFTAFSEMEKLKYLEQV